MNSADRPGKRYLPKTAPARSDVTTTLTVAASDSPALFRKKRPKGAASKIPV